jgi:hypothetical protein
MNLVCAHLGDIHLEEDHYFADTAQCLEWFVADAVQSHTNLFVVNGDLTTYKATIKERNVWVDMLIRMANHAPVLLVAGNHGAELEDDLYVLAKAKGIHPIFLCTKPEFIELDDVAIAVFPYPRKAEFAGTSGENKLSEAFLGQLQEFNERFALRPGSFRLFFGHFGVAGAKVSSGQPLVGRCAEYSLDPLRGAAKFLSRGLGYTLFLTGDEAVLALQKPAGVAPTLRSAPAGLKFGATTSVDKPATDHGPEATESVLRMKLIGANASVTVTGTEELSGKSNYFLGNDPTKWRTNVPNYAQVRYQSIYPGVDLVYYGTEGGQLEYDFVVAPGADVHSIGLGFQGTGKTRIDKSTGDLVLALDGSELRFRKPVAYQEQFTVDSSQLTVEDEKRNTTDNPKSKIQNRKFIDARFVLTGRNQIGFQVAAYDHRTPLIIDPVLIYSTYLGGGKLTFGVRVAVDASGNAYLTGATNSSDFPTTNSSTLDQGTCASQRGFFQAAYGIPSNLHFSCPDAFVTKLNPTGTALVYSTYLGGSQADGATGISVDSSGNAYVTGTTGSTDFPTTAGAFQTTTAAGRQAHAFATELNATGSALIYSTYLAGSGNDISTASALDSNDNLYVAGATTSPNFPTTSGAFQTALAGAACIGLGQRNPVAIQTPSPVPCPDGFVAKLNAAGSALVYSTYLGGSNDDSVLGLAVDSAGNAYATGVTLSTDFPTKNALYSFGTTTCGTTKGGNPKACFHAFVSELNSAGSALNYCTYLAGNGDDAGLGIAVDSTGAAYVTGATNSTNFPTTTGVAQTTFGGGSCGNSSYPFECPDAFVVKLAPLGTKVDYSTYLGGDSFDFGMAIAVDAAGNAYVVGGTDSLNFPTDDNTGNFAGGGCSIGKIVVFNSLLFYNTNPLSPSYGIATSQGTNSYPGFSLNCPNAFLTEINPTGSTRLFSTYLGGASGDVAFGVALRCFGWHIRGGIHPFG